MNVKWSVFLMFSVSLFGILFFSACSSRKERRLISASGTIEATEVNVSTKVGGQILNLLVEEGDSVQVGDTVAVIDHHTLDIQLQGAVAGVEAAQARLDLLLNGARPEEIRQAEEAVKQTQANLKLAQDDFQRTQELYQNGSTTQKQLEDQEARLTIAGAQFNSAQQALLKIQQFARPEELRSARAQLSQSVSARNLLAKSISDCYILAPTAGMVTGKAFEAGEWVGAGNSLIVISFLQKVHLSIYVTEKDLPWVKIGQEARIKIDAFRERSFPGQVVYISPNAEFTPKNVQTKEDRVKLVFEVKIEIDNPEYLLKPGLPADAEIFINYAEKNEPDSD